MNGLPLVTIEYMEYNREPHIILFLREGKRRVLKDVTGFSPYFYIPLTEKSDAPTFNTIDGKTVTKVFTQTPEDVLQERKNYPKTWEADVHFTTRYLIDCVPHIEKSDLRVQYTDIEKEPKTNIITAISVYDTYLQKCIAFAWREDLQPKQYDTEYSFPSGYKFKCTVHLYNSRINMLANYIRFIRDSDPDILTGWFFTSYDAKELIQEINSLKLKASDLSPINRAYVIGDEVGKFEQNIAIKGRILWDMLKAYAFLQPSRLPDYSLEAVAQKELGEGKVKRTMNFTDMWRKDLDTLIKYNCMDSVLVYRLDQKKKILEYFDELRRFVGCEWNTLFHETLLWDVYILRKLHGKLVLPTKQKIEIGKYTGATVLQPPKGIHQNIMLIDLKSLYPSIIMTANMSPETLVKVSENKNQENCITLPNGIGFLKEPIGLLPDILLELLEKRIEIKEQMKKYPFGTDEYETLEHQQNAVKVLANALYGAMGFHNFRLATPEIASSVTFVGRNILEFVRKELEKMGFKVIYGDTDSLFLCSNQTNLNEIHSELIKIVSTLNKELANFMKAFCNADKNYIQIEAKKIYKNLMISERKSGIGTAKKRYAGLLLWIDGETIDENSDKSLDIVGFEQRRSDSSQLSRDIQKKVIRMLLSGEPKEKLSQYINEVIQKIKLNQYDYEYIGIPKGLSHSIDSYKIDNPHRRAAMYSNKNLDLNFGLGDKPKIIYVSRTGKYPRTDVVAFNVSEDVPPDFVMDVNTMIEKSIIMKLEHLLDVANINIGELIYGSTKLEEFF